MLNDTTGRAPAEVTRVICAGVSRVEGSVMDQLFKMRNRHCESRAGARVRGALLYSSGWFVLWLEGPEADVEAVLEAATLDPCAAHQKVIHRSRGPGSLSEPFAVVSTQGAEGPAAFGRRVYHFARQVALGIEHSPAGIWRNLSAPCTAAYEPGRAPDQHIALVSAQDNGPVDLLHQLADRFHGRVVYQRFACGKSRSSDVGAAYVDVVVARQLRRVQLLSRRALPLGMVRESLSGLNGLVLLLGARPAAAIGLATGVAACLAALPARPRIYLVSADYEIPDRVGELLRESTGDYIPPAQLPEQQLTELLLRGALPPACPQWIARAADIVTCPSL